MIVVVAVHRSDHAQLIHHAAQVREPVAQLHAAAAMLAEWERAGHETIVVAAGLEALDLARVFLSVALLKLGFRIEQIDLAGTTHLQEHDDGSRRPGVVTGPRPRVGAARSRL